MSLEFTAARWHALVGPPGSGKTLLMHLLGLLDDPDFGSVEIFGESASPAAEEQRREMRNSIFGYVFPTPCLLPSFTVAENVAMPLFRLSGANEHAARDRVDEVLTQFGIAHLSDVQAAALRMDDQYLAALARALVHRPRILMLIGPARAAALAPAIGALTAEKGITCLWSALPEEWLSACDTVHEMSDGCLVPEGRIS